MKKSYTPEQALEILWDTIASDYKSNAEFAREMNVTPAYVGDVLHGRRPMSEKLANHIGMTKGFIEK